MDETDNFEEWLESVKTARILDEWIGGATVEELVESYRIGPATSTPALSAPSGC